MKKFIFNAIAFFLIFNNVNSQICITSSSPTGVICNGQSVTWYAKSMPGCTAPLSVYWGQFNGTYYNIGHGSSITVSPSTTTHYCANLTLPNNGSLDFYIIVDNPLSIPTITPSGLTTFCSGGSILLSVPSGGSTTTYQWKKDNVNIGTNVNPYVATVSGNYTVVVSNSCGSVTSSNSINVIVDSQPVTTPIVGTITQPSCTTAMGSVILNGLPANGSWTINPGNIIGNGSTFTINNLSSGTYTFTVTNAAGCISGTSASVVIYPSINANILQNDTTICSGSSITLSATGNSNMSYGVCNKTDLPLNLQNGLVAYYPFCGNANDISGNGNNGIVNGAALTSDRFGIQNKAYNFNGSSNYISIPNVAIQGGNNRSISFWIKTTSGTMILSTGTNSDVNGGDFNLRLENSFRFIGFMGGNYTQGGYDYYPTGNVVLNNNIWHNVTVTYNGSVLIFYVDGVFEKQTNISISTNGQTNFIGKSNDWRPQNAAYFNGNIDDVGFWNRILTPMEIQQLYSVTPISSYSWSNGATTQSISVAPTQSTTYYCTISNGISSCVDSVLITVLPFSANIVQNDTTICYGSTIALNSVINSCSDQGNCSLFNLPSNLQNGLVAYYPFCGNANDVSGNGNNGILHNVTLTIDRFGNSNSAYQFVGNDNNTVSYIVANHNNLPSGRTTRTISVWVTNDTYGIPGGSGNDGHPIIGYGNPSTNSANELMFFTTSSSIAKVRYGGFNNDFDMPFTYTLSTWYNLVATFDGTTASIYINNSLIGSGNYASWNTILDSLVIGAQTTRTRFHNGKIDDIFIYACIKVITV